MHIHILGICGTFMGGIAAIAKSNGHRVTGCDHNVYPPMSTQLEKQGIEIIEGFGPDQINLNPDIFIVGNVVSRGNPLMELILDKNLPYQSGPQWLYENILKDKWVLAVAGTHGKTTTTSMLSWILDYCNYEPGFLIGGVANNFNLSARSSKSDFFVIEADEYDTAFFDKRSKFIHYHPRTLILNNLEFDHADIFSSIQEIENQFHHLVRTVPSMGKILINKESNYLSNVISKGIWSEQEFFGDQDGWFYEKKSNEIFVFKNKKVLGNLKVEFFGHHNFMNTLAAIAAAEHVGIKPEDAIEALSAFKGVKRRMEKLIEIEGIKIFDDFAHHPTAIEATINAVKDTISKGRVIIAFEPRSNTMKLGSMKDQLYDSFKNADLVFCYASKELNWDAKKVFEHSSTTSVYNDIDTMLIELKQSLRKDDYLIFMSNGGFLGAQKKLIDSLQS